jgi:hypothetical protein
MPNPRARASIMVRRSAGSNGEDLADMLRTITKGFFGKFTK